MYFWSSTPPWQFHPSQQISSQLSATTPDCDNPVWSFSSLACSTSKHANSAKVLFSPVTWNGCYYVVSRVHFKRLLFFWRMKLGIGLFGHRGGRAFCICWKTTEESESAFLTSFQNSWFLSEISPVQSFQSTDTGLVSMAHNCVPYFAYSSSSPSALVWYPPQPLTFSYWHNLTMSYLSSIAPINFDQASLCFDSW